MIQFDLPVFALRPYPMSFNGKKASQSASTRAAGRFADNGPSKRVAGIGIGLAAIAYSEIDTARRSRWPYLKERGQRFRCIHAGLKRRRGVLKMECCHQDPTYPLRIVPFRRVALRDCQCRSVRCGRNRLNPTNCCRMADQALADSL